MSAQAAQRLGYYVAILDPSPTCPAAQVTPRSIQGSFSDIEALKRLASISDVITLEHEWVDPDQFRTIERSGCPVYPSPDTLAYLVDKLSQRRRLAGSGLPGPRAEAIPEMDAAGSMASVFGWPIVLKARHGGYDGYGVRIVRSADEWDERRPKMSSDWYAEEHIPFSRELAVMVARGRDGATAVYPVVESIQTSDGHRCDTVIAPAGGLTDAVRREAEEIAVAAVEAVGGVGLFGVELFLVDENHILINEMAPRPHNSGHYTMNGSMTSQFEQHIRAIAGLPLGPTGLTAGACVMTNLLGSRNGTFSQEAALVRALEAVPGAHIHWYGKSDLRLGRKMGHINATGPDIASAQKEANAARDAFWNEDAHVK